MQNNGCCQPLFLRYDVAASWPDILIHISKREHNSHLPLYSLCLYAFLNRNNANVPFQRICAAHGEKCSSFFPPIENRNDPLRLRYHKAVALYKAVWAVCFAVDTDDAAPADKTMEKLVGCVHSVTVWYGMVWYGRFQCQRRIFCHQVCHNGGKT